MAWLDDRIWCHEKLLELSDRAHRVYTNSLAYSAGMATRGVLTLPQQKLLGATPPARSQLISVGLWDELEDGKVRIHDWDEHNGKRDERRARDRERKREFRKTSAGQSAGRPTERRALKEVKVVKVVKEPLASEARVRNPIWDALTEVFGEASTESARSLRGKVVRSLTAAGATHAEILNRARSWPRHFEDATLTETALEKHWGALGRKPLRMEAR